MYDEIISSESPKVNFGEDDFSDIQAAYPLRSGDPQVYRKRTSLKKAIPVAKDLMGG